MFPSIRRTHRTHWPWGRRLAVLTTVTRSMLACPPHHRRRTTLAGVGKVTGPLFHRRAHVPVGLVCSRSGVQRVQGRAAAAAAAAT